VLSGRTVEEVADEPDRVWHSNRSEKKAPAAQSETKVKQKASAKRGKETASWPDPSELSGARKGSLPDFVEPQLATLVAEAPNGETWLHEIKLDGYRMQARCDGEGIAWLTRRGHDWSERLPSLSAELSALGFPPALLDGELVVLQSGVSNFQQLQNSLNEQHDGRVVYYAFDLLYLAGYDLRAVPLVERKALLAALLQAAGTTHETSRIRLSGHVVGQGPAFFARACELGVEGSVCKRADGRYASGRSRDWLKVKCLQRQEFVIGGFSEPSGARSHFGALLLGVQGERGLEYAGRVGTGFSERSLSELHEKLTPLERARPAFVAPPRGADARGVHWVEPELVAEVEFAERTSDGLVRHASFRGLREDKPAKQVHEERPEPVPAARTAGPRAKGSTKSKSTKTKSAKSDAAKSKSAKSESAKSKSASSKAARGASAKSAQPSQPLPALRSVRLTHPDRVLYAEQGITKADLALYYAQVAERMLPQVARRPLMIVRCPRGQGAECFHQKHPGLGTSAAIKRVKIAESKGVLESMYVEDAEGLVQLVQMGALEVHTWGSRVDDVEHPDQLTFDLDPDEGLAWSEVAAAARALKARLDQLELPSFLKTTGGKGLHLVVPIEPSVSWEVAKQFCHDVAAGMMRRQPDKYVITISKAQRKGKLLIDYFRNGRGATAVCAYSTRAREGAPVALPIAWRELSAKERPRPLAVNEVAAHIGKTPDPWADFGAHRPALTEKRLRAAAARQP
jgi:bifunctional non-homologous end joining protein LigD